MRASRMILFWLAVIVILVFVEVAEITHLFVLPIQSVLGNVLSFVFALVFTTILALIGAIFIGIYISHRILSPRGFSPFEEEMLEMRADLLETRRTLEAIRERLDVPPRGDPPGGTKPEEGR